MELEKEILMALICDTNTRIYLEKLEDKYFEDKMIGYILNAIKKVNEENKEATFADIKKYLRNKIKDDNKYKLVDDLIMECVSNYWGAYSDSIKTNIEILINTYNKKQLDVFLTEIKNITESQEELNILEVKEQLLDKLNSLDTSSEKENYTELKDLIAPTLDELEKNNKKDLSLNMNTGFRYLDMLTDGLHEAELTCIGARPGTGKTAFALNISQSIGQRRKVYFLSLEMNNIQMTNRLLSYYSEVNAQAIRSGKINVKQDYPKIANGVNLLEKLNIKLDCKTRYIEELENQLRILKYRNDLDVVVIDYLTLLKSKGKYASRELEVSEISRKLKLLALELNIPIIILVQLNRDAENKEPTMANIRESGSIEQNCDNIIFLYNKNPETFSDAIIEVEVILAKQRQGATGKFALKFDKRYSKFINKEM